MIYLSFEAIQFKPTCKAEDIAKLKELLLTLQVLPQNASFSRTYAAGHFIVRTLIPRGTHLALQSYSGQGYMVDDHTITDEFINQYQLNELISIAEGAAAQNEGFDVRNPLAAWLGTTYENFGTMR